MLTPPEAPPDLDNRMPSRQPTPSHRRCTVLLAAAYVTVLATANVLTSRLGLVPAGFGLAVTAGTYPAGLALALRDALHDTSGVRVVLLALGAGAGLSAVTADPRIAVASTAAALAGELVDLAVYAPLRHRNRTTAIALSGAIGGLIDTLGFLSLAGFPLTPTSIGGQLLVKAVWVTGVYLALRGLLTGGVRRVVSGQRQLTRDS